MRALAAATALCLARAALAAEGETSLWAGLNYARGSYGGPGTTEVVAIPFTARYENGPWILRGTLPYLHISGPGAVVPGVGRVDGGGGGGGGDLLGLGLLGGGGGNRSGGSGDSAPSTTSETSVSGLGDASASVTYLVYGAGNRSGVGLSGKLKFPTGDETRGLGTGGTDTSVQVDAFQRMDATTVFAGVGYTFFGASPILELENVANGSLGLTQRIAGNDSLGLAFDLRQGGSPAPAPQRELSAFWIHRIDRSWRTHAYVMKGFAAGSPDWGAGIAAAYAF